MEKRMQAIIGDYQAFFSDLLRELTASGIKVQGLPVVQLLYRTSTMPEYQKVRDSLKQYCREFVETDFNGRPIAILILEKPLDLGEGFSVDMIELAAPRPAHMYQSGLESVGLFVGSKLQKFKKRYKKALTGVKDHGVHCQPAFITFENGKTVKFYDVTLKDIVLLQGWRFEQVDQPGNSEENVMANRINSWVHYLYTIDDWHALVKRTKPKEVGCGTVYELANPIDRPNESFAIADMSKIAVAEPHYHVETEIYFVVQGRGRIVIGSKEISLQKDTVVVIPSNTAHYTIPTDSNLVLAVVNTPAFKPENYHVLTDSNKAVGFDRKQFERVTRKQ